MELNDKDKIISLYEVIASNKINSAPPENNHQVMPNFNQSMPNYVLDDTQRIKQSIKSSYFFNFYEIASVLS